MELEERLSINDQCERDIRFREQCRRRVMHGDDADVFFINAFTWTFDPRIDPATKRPIGAIPFLLWEKQEEYVRFIGACIDEAEDGAAKKSRDVGATYCTEYPIGRRWLYVDGFQALLGTRKEDLVDPASNPDGLFWKLDFMIQWLPEWLYPEGFDATSSICRSWMKLYNPAKNSGIHGEAPVKDFGRSGRYTVALLDEWAFWQNGKSAAASVQGSTPCRLFVSTPAEVIPNHFDDLLHQKNDYSETFIRQEIIHWKDDPRKNMTAVDEKTGEIYYPFKLSMIGDARRGIKGRITKEVFAREYDIDFEGSVTGTIYKEQMPFARIGNFPYNPKYPLYASIDFGVDDTCVIGYFQWNYEEFRYRMVGYYKNNGHGIGFYAPMFKGSVPGEILEFEPFYDFKDMEAISKVNSWKRNMRTEMGSAEFKVPLIAVYGDPAGRARGQSDGRSAKAVLDEDYDIYVTDNVSNDARSFNGRIRESRNVLINMDFDASCRPVYDILKTYHYKLGKPVHDESSHYAAMVQYFAVNSPHKQDIILRGEGGKSGRADWVGSIFGDPRSIPEGRGLNVPFYAASVTDSDIDAFYQQIYEDDDDEPRNIRKRRGRTGYGF